MRDLSRRRLTALLAASVTALMLSGGMAPVASLPRSIVVRSGSATEMPTAAFLSARVDSGDADLSGGPGGMALRAGDAGSARLTYSLLGVLPVKTVNVSVEPERVLMPGGQSVGIAIDTEGVIVVGASDLGQTPSPIRTAGIRTGDIIKKVNGQSVESAKALTGMVDGGETLRLDVERGGERMTKDVTPALDGRDGHWRLGAWVRDSTAGVGTLTFIDPETGLFGALGHAITDVDTSVTMPVGRGELYENRVVDVSPSAQGAPGELTGDFVFHPTAIGEVERNTGRGIFGSMDVQTVSSHYPEGLPVAPRREIHTGPATLLTTVDGGEVGEYGCEIVRLNDRGGDARDMVIKVTDAALIEKTGGIVQGMSGSPIIQDGKLIGAVTHVMVNDPRMGYAISLESMLESAAA